MSEGLSDNPTQQLVCVDSRGKENGRFVDRKTGHTAPGIKHLAIQVLVFNSSGDLVLHERPLKKVGGGVLDAPTTHILKGETKEESALRCLRNEYGISGKVDVKILGGYSYEKDYADGSCENEYCVAAFAVYDEKIIPNAEHTGKVFFIPAKSVLRELDSGSKSYPVWFRETIEIVKKDANGKKFFS